MEQVAWDGAGQVEGGSPCLCQPEGSEGYVTVRTLVQGVWEGFSASSVCRGFPGARYSK